MCIYSSSLIWMFGFSHCTDTIIAIIFLTFKVCFVWSLLLVEAYEYKGQAGKLRKDLKKQ